MKTNSRKAGMGSLVLLLALVALVPPATPAAAQDSTDERIEALEEQIDALRRAIAELVAQAPAQRVAELEAQIEVLAEEIEKLNLGAAASDAAEADEGLYGLGIAASKVYRVEEGLSIGGYGEMVFESYASKREGGEPTGFGDTIDFLRAIVYVGYKFDERWVFNSEIEFEHASTSKSGSASVEFAYVDYLATDNFGLRAGMLLMPMGLVNEFHEPTVFMGAERPVTEQAIIPSTWRENGGGVYYAGDTVAVRAYVVNGLNGAKFSASGVRGGRQKGARAQAEDFAWTGRLDYTATPGLIVGVSAYVGNSGQGLLDPSGATIDARTEILDFHFDWSHRGFRLRGLWAQGDVGDAARLNGALGITGSDSIGERLEGHYLELAYDVLSHRGGRASLSPFVRIESIDTQVRVPAGFEIDPIFDREILTWGAAWQPIDRLVFKAGYQDWTNPGGTGFDEWNLAMGYLF
jgi:hypothetical protein